MIAYFINEKNNLIIAIFDLMKLQKKKKKLNQTTIILNLFENYEIRNKLGYMIINNIYINDILIFIIAECLYKNFFFMILNKNVFDTTIILLI